MLDDHSKLLSKEIEVATKITFMELCKNKEHFYYCSLITSGDGASPCFSAWSKEALEKLSVEAMVSDMKSLDKAGIFDLNQKRDHIVINVEVMTPDESNTERAYLLNSISTLNDWLNEAAE